MRYSIENWKGLPGPLFARRPPPRYHKGGGAIVVCWQPSKNKVLLKEKKLIRCGMA